MPIKGLTDRGLQFPQIGNIRKGAPKGTNRPGKDLSYFRVEFDELEVESAKLFKKEYGDEPKQIDIVLPFVKLEDNWDAWLEAYQASRLVGRSDGEFIQYLVDVKSGEVMVNDWKDAKGNKVPHRAVACMDANDKPVMFKAVGRLKVVLPVLGRAAYLMAHTTSYLDVRNLSGQLEMIERMGNGNCQGIPMILKRRPQMVSVPRGDGYARMEKWMLTVEVSPGYFRQALEAQRRIATPRAVTVVADEVELLDDGMDDDFLPAEETVIDATMATPTENDKAVGEIIARMQEMDDTPPIEYPTFDETFPDAAAGVPFGTHETGYMMTEEQQEGMLRPYTFVQLKANVKEWLENSKRGDGAISKAQGKLLYASLASIMGEDAEMKHDVGDVAKMIKSKLFGLAEDATLSQKQFDVLITQWWDVKRDDKTSEYSHSKYAIAEVWAVVHGE